MNGSNDIIISETALVSKTKTGKFNKIYKNAEVKNCNFGDYITIGDDTIVLDTILAGNNSINRRNYILRSEIGKFCYTGIGTMIRSAKIGNFCSISWNVSIGGGDHPHDKVTTSTLSRFHFLHSGMRNEDSNRELNKTYLNQKNCNIGNDVLISSNVIIMRDISIGNGAVIGAGAVVTKDVEPYSLVVGVPAKPIRKRFPDDIIAALEEIKWWNWPIGIIYQNLDLIYSTRVDLDLINKMDKISKQIEQV